MGAIIVLTTEEFELLCLLAQGEKVKLPQETSERLMMHDYIERRLGSWIVTSRGHAAIFRGSDPPSEAA